MRPRPAIVVVLAATVVTGLLSVGAALDPSRPGPVPLAGEGAAHAWTLTGGEVVGSDVVVATGTAPSYLPGSRVLDPGLLAEPAVREAAVAEAARQRAWLAAGSLPGAGGRHESLVEAALLDLYVATHDPDGAVHAPYAAPTGAWRYVWPRDAAFVAVALARTGHADEAARVLEFFDGVEHDGGYHARYRADGSVPDDRGTQLDGAAWLLWASDEVVASTPPDGRTAVLERLEPVIGTSADMLLAATASPDRLPPASSDYWEVSETRLTLGIAAPVLTGLDALAALRSAQGRDDDADAAVLRHTQVRDAVVTAFGPRWPRHAGGRSQDAATAFTLPPFQAEPLPGAEAAWRLSTTGMTRPAGGLAPGQDWSEPRYSWTPQTLLYALAAAGLGERVEAEARLDWIAEHTTATGSVPEKVGPDGEGAQVSPLVWSSSLVVLTAHALERG